MLPKVVVDGRLVTGQNPYSTAAVADAVVVALGRAPVPRTPWRDEQSMALVQRLLDGDTDAARTQLAAGPETFHVELIGILGYYQLQAASDDTAVRNALAIMQLAAPHMPEPRLTLGIAEAHLRLGDTDTARAMVRQVLDIRPGMAEAEALLARLDE